eukprot:gene24934-33429_t
MIGPVTYTACRYVVSTFLLLLYKVLVHSRIAVSSRYVLVGEKVSKQDENSWKEFYNLMFWSSIQAVVGTGGFILQQIGLIDVSAGKTSFITGMYVVFVPILEYFTPGFGTQLTISRWIAALTSLGGLFLLSGCGESQVCFGGAIKWGEIIVLLSMALISVSIMVSDIANKQVDVVMVTLLEFFLTAIFAGLLAVIFETENFQYPFSAIRQNWTAIVTVGVTEGIGLLLANLGQMYTDSSRAALLFSLEVVYCAGLGYLFLHETLSITELLGCALMLAAAVLSSTSEGADSEVDDDVTMELVESQYQDEGNSIPRKREGGGRIGDRLGEEVESTWKPAPAYGSLPIGP